MDFHGLMRNQQNQCFYVMATWTLLHRTRWRTDHNEYGKYLIHLRRFDFLYQSLVYFLNSCLPTREEGLVHLFSSLLNTNQTNSLPSPAHQFPLTTFLIITNYSIKIHETPGRNFQVKISKLMGKMGKNHHPDCNHNITAQIRSSVTWAQARTKQQGLMIAFQLFYKIK